MDDYFRSASEAVEKGNRTLVLKDFKGIYHSNDTSATYTREEVRRMLEIYFSISQRPQQTKDKPVDSKGFSCTFPNILK